MTVHCAKCGEYQAGSYVIDELDTLREKDHWRIQWLQEGIARSSELLKIARYEPAKVLVLKPSAPKKMTRFEKKLRRRATRTTVSIGFIFKGRRDDGTEEIETLRLTAVPMTEAELDTYVGEYREQKLGWTLIIERDGRELKLIFPPNTAFIRAIPVGNHFFTVLAFKQTLEFTLENGTVTQLTRRGGQTAPQRFSKEK